MSDIEVSDRNRRYYISNRDSVRARQNERDRQSVSSNSERNRRWRQNNRDHFNKWQRNYRKNGKQKRDLQVIAKPDRCDICGKECNVQYDHCHVLLSFRGWLCGSCNRALGLVKDNIEILKSMIAYLERHEKPSGG